MWAVVLAISHFLRRCSHVLFVGPGWWRVYNFIDAGGRYWGEFATTGFVTSYAVVEPGLVFVLIVGFYMVWSLASFGPAPKAFCMVLMIALGIPIYPIVTGFMLAIVWILTGIAVLTFSVVGPVCLVGAAYIGLFRWVVKFVEHQRKQPEHQDDVSFFQLLFGLAIVPLTLCTFGVAGFLLTVLKSPIVFVSCIRYGISTAIPYIDETGDYYPLAVIAGFFALAGAACIFVVGLALASLCTLILAAVWPAYVAALRLRFWFDHLGRKDPLQSRATFAPIVEALKGGYQVLWAADLATNACFRMRFDLLQQLATEFTDIATGHREQLSPECRALSYLPPVVVILSLGSWDRMVRAIAKDLDISDDGVRSAWDSITEQMIKIGQEALAEGLLTEEYVQEMPPELMVGLPARVLLETIEQSSESDLVFPSGHHVPEGRRPRGPLADKLWEQVRKAKIAQGKLKLAPNEVSMTRVSLCGALLAGGGSPDGLPPKLAKGLREFGNLPAHTHSACEALRKPLIAVATECSRHVAFRDQLREVLQAVTALRPSAPGAHGRVPTQREYMLVGMGKR